MNYKNLKQNVIDTNGMGATNFLVSGVDDLLTYRTPKKIIDYIELEKIKLIIGNPPFFIKRVKTNYEIQN